MDDQEIIQHGARFKVDGQETVRSEAIVQVDDPATVHQWPEMSTGGPQTQWSEWK